MKCGMLDTSSEIILLLRDVLEVVRVRGYILIGQPL